MPAQYGSDPYSGFNFLVEIDGVLVGAFSEVTGLESDVDAVAHREDAAGSRSDRKILGLRKFPNLTLKGGVAQAESLWAWYENSPNNMGDKRKITVVQRAKAGREIARWHVLNAWIEKVQGPRLRASGTDVAIESMQLGCEGLIVAP
jgi:phage tail-like protein